MTAFPCRVDIETPIHIRSSSSSHTCALYMGTCGYSYTEWVDSGFYPPKTKSSGMLDLYGRLFSVVELNLKFPENVSCCHP